jgi:Domain of unknown function (DUF4861)
MIAGKLFLLFSILLLASVASVAETTKVIKVAIENPTDVARPAADIVLTAAQLRAVAPDLNPGCVFVTATSASTPQQDASATDVMELPSQVDDLDQDDKVDELAFQIDLAPKQTRIVTIHYGPPDQILRLRKDYPLRTNALFSTKIEGLGWESEAMAFRVYFDPRNAIDIYGKRNHSLQLRLYSTPEYPYHEESPEGRDIYKVGEAIGVGGLAAWVDGKVVKAANVRDRKWRIISTGPVRTIVELEYNGWNLGSRTVNVHSRITMWAGEHGFYQAITTNPASGTEFVTGLPLKLGLAPIDSQTQDSAAIWQATWGEQVVAPGPTATEAIAGQNLGLAIVVANPSVQSVADAHNYLLKFAPRDGNAIWYTMAVWDQEGKNTVSGSTETNLTKDQFLALVQDQVLRMEHPAATRFVSAAKD